MKLCHDDRHDIHIKMSIVAERISAKILGRFLPLWLRVADWTHRLSRFM